MSRSAEFSDAAGRHYVEHDMPESLAYKHPIRSYGEARRLSVYDPSDTTKRSFNTDKGIIKDENGEPGLVGVSDFYREPESHSFQDVNIGYMQVAPEHRGGGIGRQMFDYMHKTTPEGNQLNVGLAASDETLHMAKKAEKEKPGSVKWKMF
jgi:GNAT superfamily N-acetyltransferase